MVLVSAPKNIPTYDVISWGLDNDCVPYFSRLHEGRNVYSVYLPNDTEVDEFKTLFKLKWG